MTHVLFSCQVADADADADADAKRRSWALGWHLAADCPPLPSQPDCLHRKPCPRLLRPVRGLDLQLEWKWTKCARRAACCSSHSVFSVSFQCLFFSGMDWSGVAVGMNRRNEPLKALANRCSPLASGRQEPCGEPLGGFSGARGRQLGGEFIHGLMPAPLDEIAWSGHPDPVQPICKNTGLSLPSMLLQCPRHFAKSTRDIRNTSDRTIVQTLHIGV